MTNVLLAQSLSDDATLTGTDALGDNSLPNLQRRDGFRVYRTATTATIDIDLGTAKEIDLIALAYHNGIGTVTIKAGTTDAVTDFTTGSLNLITGTDVGNDLNLFAELLDTAQTYRYWQIEIADSSNPDGFFQASRLYLSKAFIPSTNAAYGYKEGRVDPTKVRRTITGAAVPNKRNILRQADWSLEFATQAEMYGEALKIDKMAGASSDLLFIPDMEDTDYFQDRWIYGIIDSIQPIEIAAFNIFQKRYKITEIK